MVFLSFFFEVGNLFVTVSMIIFDLQSLKKLRIKLFPNRKEIEVKDVQLTKIEKIRAANREHSEHTQHNIHIAERERMKFDYGRLIDELYQNHSSSQARIESEQDALI